MIVACTSEYTYCRLMSEQIFFRMSRELRPLILYQFIRFYIYADS